MNSNRSIKRSTREFLLRLPRFIVGVGFGDDLEEVGNNW
jgi:hypothetical protein